VIYLEFTDEQVKGLSVFKNEYLLLKARDDTEGIVTWKENVANYFTIKAEAALAILRIMLKKTNL
jgi:hypothetical protein